MQCSRVDHVASSLTTQGPLQRAGQEGTLFCECQPVVHLPCLLHLASRAFVISSRMTPTVPPSGCCEVIMGWWGSCCWEGPLPVKR